MEQIKIGTKYKDRKTGVIMSVTEIFKVYNSKNELVRVFYSSKGMQGNIPVINGDVCGITIQKYLIK